jgi:very-short-patch-repair endonuclease
MGQKDPADDRKLAVVAARQHGRVAHWQLRAMGFSPRAIEYRARTGRLHRVHKGVYAVGHSTVTQESREMAAVLACGEAAVVSHWTAAARWGLLRPQSGAVHVTVVGDRRDQRGIRVHRVKELHPHDRGRRDGIPVTSVARTLLDLAAVAPAKALARAVNQADRQGQLHRRAIRELLNRHPRRRGTKALKAVIAAVDPATRRTRSDLEVAFRQLCRRRKIEPPISNAIVEGIEVDMYRPKHKLIVELDFFDYHRTPAEFANDRRRDAHLKINGHMVLRVPDEWLDSDPDGVADTVEALLSQTAPRGAPRSPSAQAAAPRP